MKIRQAGIIGASLLLGLAACGGGESTTTQDAAPVATSAAPTVPAEADTNEGCDVSESTGSTENTELQAFAQAQFDRLDCGDSTTLADQLQALFESTEFKSVVKDQGWTADSGEAMGGVSVAIVDLDPQSACRITVLDSPAKAKTMDCQDV